VRVLRLQLADFGLAKHLVNQTHMTTVCGTWAYSAPEVRIFRKPYNYKVDIWSLGVILFTMCVVSVLIPMTLSCIQVQL
jgi:serine/threonine protein kinase